MLRWLFCEKEAAADCPSLGINADGMYMREEGNFLNARIPTGEVISIGGGDYGQAYDGISCILSIDGSL